MYAEDLKKSNRRVTLIIFSFLFAVGVVSGFMVARTLGRWRIFWEDLDARIGFHFMIEYGWWVFSVLAILSLIFLIVVAGYVLGKHNAKKAVVAAWVALSFLLLFVVLGIFIHLGISYSFLGN